MVGWFSLRVEDSHCAAPNDTPFILHYDSGSADLRPFFWPTDKKNKKFKPSELNKVRHTHSFVAPSCYCAWLDGKKYTESKIGLALRVNPSSDTENLGEYIAVCADQKCGYLVVLDTFYRHNRLLKREYPEREVPVATLDPFHFITGDTEETVKRAGLRQVQILQNDADSSLRGSRMLLRREDPDKFVEFERLLEKLLKNGLSSEKFWDIFVQCTTCNYVMPRHYFPYAHPCTTSVVEANLALTANVSSVLRKRLRDSEDTSDDEGSLSLNSDSGKKRCLTPAELGSDDTLPDVLDILSGRTTY
ncbi:hypothetical protein FA13DRAFT_1796257 [Coprinellus micaceus]|uniref:Uncharacterized protein n=1 Tax=Coprinellus micaceus TaxID=71717 RepID=A0A4Y7SV53_COPMI|nr:hypothetical protein FA13DRAFT_1796257 [Coprinellus micaceus]